jgi:hypothetical protein
MTTHEQLALRRVAVITTDGSEVLQRDWTR